MDAKEVSLRSLLVSLPVSGRNTLLDHGNVKWSQTGSELRITTWIGCGISGQDSEDSKVGAVQCIGNAELCTVVIIIV